MGVGSHLSLSRAGGSCHRPFWADTAAAFARFAGGGRGAVVGGRWAVGGVSGRGRRDEWQGSRFESKRGRKSAAAGGGRRGRRPVGSRHSAVGRRRGPAKDAKGREREEAAADRPLPIHPAIQPSSHPTIHSSSSRQEAARFAGGSSGKVRGGDGGGRRRRGASCRGLALVRE